MRTLFTPLAAVAALAALTGCGGGGGGSGTGALKVTMHDTAVDTAENVFVTVDAVEIFRSDGAGGEIKETLVSTPAQYDLLTLQDGVEAVLGTGQFPVGDYTSIRLIIGVDSKSDIETLPADELKNYIVIDGVAYALIVPSGAQTGIKFNHVFTLSSDVIKTLTFDFDVRQSVHQRGHQPVFNLRPTLRLVDTVISGTISGTVSTSDDSAIPAGTVVSAQQAGVEVASATVDVASGAYLIGPLLAGSYDLVAIAPGYGIQTELGVVVVAQTDSAGHDFVLTPSAVGDVNGTVAVTTTLPENVVVSLMSGGFLVAQTGIDSATGAYAFTGVAVGDYTVVATDVTIPASTDSGAATVTDGATTTVDLTLP
jgi:hypothetical protein